MSSFRIDRQYVAFQTAETEPVYATSQAQRSSQEPAGGIAGGAADFAGDISKLYDEIYEKLSREHAEQAELILSRASLEAREIVENANKKAGELLGRAKDEAAQLMDTQKAEIERASMERKYLEEQELLGLEASLRKSYDELVGGMHDEIVALVMEIVRKIIGYKLSQSDDIFLGLVRDALERLKQTGSVVIRVGPEDYARYFGSDRGLDLDAGETKVAVVEEQDFSTGDLIVESEGELIDLSIGRQIDQIENAFMN